MEEISQHDSLAMKLQKKFWLLVAYHVILKKKVFAHFSEKTENFLSYNLTIYYLITLVWYEWPWGKSLAVVKSFTAMCSVDQIGVFARPILAHGPHV